MTRSLPVRAGRWTSLGRQLLLGAPVIVGTLLFTLLLLILLGLGWALAFLTPAAPASILLAGWIARRIDRFVDGRRSCVTLDGTTLQLPTSDGEVRFHLDRPLVAESGWWNNQTKEPGEPGVRDASRGVFLILEQEDRAVILHADDSNARAWKHRIAFRKPPRVPERQVRVWAADLVALIVAMRERA